MNDKTSCESIEEFNPYGFLYESLSYTHEDLAIVYRKLAHAHEELSHSYAKLANIESKN